MSKPIHSNGSWMQTVVIVILIAVSAYFIIFAFWPDRVPSFFNRLLP